MLHEAHGESLQHQSACAEAVNGLISAHYIDLLGTWVPFRALRAGGGGQGQTVGSVRGKTGEHKEENKRWSPCFCLDKDGCITERKRVRIWSLATKIKKVTGRANAVNVGGALLC